MVVCDLFGTVKYNHRYVDCNKAITNTVANMKVTNKNSGKVFTYGVTKEFEIYDIYKLPEDTIRNDIMSNIYHNVYLPEGKPLFSDFYAKPWPSRESSPIVYDMSKAVTGVNLISAGRFTNGGLAYTLSNTSGRLWCQGSKGPRIPTQNEYPSRKITYMVDNVTISTRYTDAKGMTSFPSNPSKSGYLFQGWYVNTRKASSLTVFTKDSIVVAKFIKLVNLTSVSASISTTSHTYTGAAICPVVTVKYGTTTLVKDKDYTVSYGNNTNIGKATILIKGKGTYTGSKSITFQIIPRKAVISKLTSGSKGRLSVTWKKDTMVTGYQIQYSTSGSFEKSVKTVTIKNNKTVSSTISNLTSKKVYYVRIRSYKTIGGVTYYGPYSLVMKVGVK